MRKVHKPKPATRTHHRSKAGDDKPQPFKNANVGKLACSDCIFCFCTCQDFVEPFEGQKFMKCPADHGESDNQDGKRQPATAELKTRAAKNKRV
jgi:hypothetical protein